MTILLSTTTMVVAAVKAEAQNGALLFCKLLLRFFDSNVDADILKIHWDKSFKATLKCKFCY